MKSRCKFIRKRKDTSSSDDETTPNYGKRKQIDKNFIFSSKSLKKDVIVEQYQADKTSAKSGPKDGGATAISEIDTEYNKDAQAVFERIQQDKVKYEDDGLYHGIKFYDRTEIKDTVAGKASSGFNRKGPMRAPTNIRSTTRWDYQPDICKDYKETGFCGFGDSCKFLHDRSDYKFGWQLEMEEKKCHDHSGDESDEDKYIIRDDDEAADANIPHCCSYCRGDFVEPVVTRCRHYFCSSCALQMHKDLKGRCQVCDTDTEGHFSNADFVLERLRDIDEKRTAGRHCESDSD